MKLCALSVDLDEIPCYHAIFGLPPASGDAAHAVYLTAVPRYLDLLRELEVPGTFFVVGSDLAHELSSQRARALLDAGHELGNHTLSHPYDLTRHDRAFLRAEVQGGIDALARLQGHAPAGFRAPGYTVTGELLDVLVEAGVQYDSSVFPCPPYWAAKAAAMAAIRLSGRRSRAVLDTPAVLLAPADPYRPARPYWKRSPRGAGLLEIPVGVTRGLRLPFIGLSLHLAGPAYVDWLVAQIAGRPLVDVELHGIDLLDVHDGIGALAPHQMDVRLPVARKAQTIRRLVAGLRARGYRFVTLAAAARIVGEGATATC